MTRMLLFAVLAGSVASAQTPDPESNIPCVPKHVDTALWLALEYLEPHAPGNLLTDDYRLSERAGHMEIIQSVRTSCGAELAFAPVVTRVDCSPENTYFALFVALQYLEPDAKPDASGTVWSEEQRISLRDESMRFIRAVKDRCVAETIHPRTKPRRVSEKENATAPALLDDALSPRE